jgi:hypothetical protein
MNETTRFDQTPRRAADSPGDVDGVLRAYFQAEMPDPWPAPNVLADVGPPAVRRAPTLLRSRWALAATVLGLLLGHAFLSGRFPESVPTQPDRDSTSIIGRKSGPAFPNQNQFHRDNPDARKSR